jgi:hypothetical protein
MKPSTGAIIKRIIVVLAVLYAGSYLLLSLNGRYEPGSAGPTEIKSYTWAPKGFVENFNATAFLPAFYLPLWACDCRFWHTMDKAESGTYPIHKVAPEDIGKVSEAWKRP